MADQARPRSSSQGIISVKAYVEQLRSNQQDIIRQACTIVGVLEKQFLDPAGRFIDSAAAQLTQLCNAASQLANSQASLNTLVVVIKSITLHVYIVQEISKDSKSFKQIETRINELVAALAKITLLGFEFGCDQRRGGGQASPAVEARSAALFLLAALQAALPDAVFGQWTVFFPDIKGNEYGTRHVLLTPLLFDATSVKSGAQAFIVEMMTHSASQLQLANEADKRQSFASLSARMAHILQVLHEAAFYGLRTLDRDSSGRSIICNTLAAVVLRTPYTKCPLTTKALLQFLAQDTLRAMLGRSATEANAALGLIGNVWRSQYLPQLATFAESTPGAALVESVSETLPAVEAWRCLANVAKVHPSSLRPHWPRILSYLEAIAGVDPAKTKSLRVPKNCGEEAMKLVTNFFGCVWQPFDPTQRDVPTNQPNAGGTADINEKDECFRRVLLPALGTSCEEVRVGVIRVLSHIGDEYITAKLATGDLESLVQKMGAAATDASTTVRSEALTTIGVWGWLYASMDAHVPAFVEKVVSAFYHDKDHGVVIKAASAIANVAARAGLQPSLPLVHVRALLEASLIMSEDRDPQVASHSTRALAAILLALSVDDLIMELDGYPDGAANAVLTRLVAVISGRDPKQRWNAAYAIGECLSKVDVFQADPPAAVAALQQLVACVGSDSSFKVRSQAAVALGKIPFELLRQAACVPVVFSALCNTLAPSEAANFKQFKEHDVLLAQARKDLSSLLNSMAPLPMQAPEVQAAVFANRPLLISEHLVEDQYFAGSVGEGEKHST